MALDTRRVTWLALIALFAGLLLGAALARAGTAALPALLAVLEPIGTLWINAVRMTIIPLVISMLIAAVASSDDIRSMGRLGGAALAFFFATLMLVGVFAALATPLLLSGLTIDPQAAASLRATASADAERVAATVSGMGGFTQRLVEMVPTNPFRAAADGAMLPLIVFSMIFAVALSRTEPRHREAAVGFFRAVSEAMLVVIKWVFLAAPVGVFALAVMVGARLGYAAVAAVGYYVGVFVALMLAVMLFMYPVAAVFGRVPLRRFAAAAAPAQVIAVGSRSSSVSLPAMIDGASNILRLPERVVSFVLPAAVAIFRISGPVSFLIGALFLSRLYDVPLDGPQIASLVLLGVLLSFSVPPVPSGSLFLMAPVLADFGIPVEGVAILIAIDAIPDLAKTAGNVTANMAAATVVARFAGTAPADGAVRAKAVAA